ncbi:MAG: hypothetical protein KAR40_09085 [Candidatus Sabulitectum sp.]|nr:hypothetical protein [Candidatus Sabulitectum sp.]
MFIILAALRISAEFHGNLQLSSEAWYLTETYIPSSAIVRMCDYAGTQSKCISFDAVRLLQQTSIDDQNYSNGSGNGSFGISRNPVLAGSHIMSFSTALNTTVCLCSVFAGGKLQQANWL